MQKIKLRSSNRAAFEAVAAACRSVLLFGGMAVPPLTFPFFLRPGDRGKGWMEEGEPREATRHACSRHVYFRPYRGAHDSWEGEPLADEEGLSRADETEEHGFHQNSLQCSLWQFCSPLAAEAGNSFRWGEIHANIQNGRCTGAYGCWHSGQAKRRHPFLSSIIKQLTVYSVLVITLNWTCFCCFGIFQVSKEIYWSKWVFTLKFKNIVQI